MQIFRGTPVVWVRELEQSAETVQQDGIKREHTLGGGEGILASRGVQQATEQGIAVEQGGIRAVEGKYFFCACSARRHLR